MSGASPDPAEDAEDAAAAIDARRELAETAEQPAPWDEVKSELELAESRREAIDRLGGTFRGMYPPGYLAALRDEWPE